MSHVAKYPDNFSTSVYTLSEPSRWTQKIHTYSHTHTHTRTHTPTTQRQAQAQAAKSAMKNAATAVFRSFVRAERVYFRRGRENMSNIVVRVGDLEVLALRRTLRGPFDDQDEDCKTHQHTPSDFAACCEWSPSRSPQDASRGRQQVIRDVAPGSKIRR